VNEKIKNHVAEYCKKEGWGTDEKTIIEVIRESEVVWSKDLGSSRWWGNEFRVCEIDGMFIGYNDAYTTGDDSPWDKGYEFDPKYICEVEKKEETKVVVTFKRK
jgi:hypothetical protein